MITDAQLEELRRLICAADRRTELISLIEQDAKDRREGKK